MAYATYTDVQKRMLRQMSDAETTVCNALLDDAAVLIDSTSTKATDAVKLTVSCRMVIRALGDGTDSGVPTGATQGSVSALGYSQSWTISSGSVGQLYLDKTDRKLLGLGNAIGSRSPIESIPEEV
jgi:hypothetical protein